MIATFPVLLYNKAVENPAANGEVSDMLVAFELRLFAHTVCREAFLWLGAAAVLLSEPLAGSFQSGFAVIWQGRFQIFWEVSQAGCIRRNLFIAPDVSIGK